MIRDEIVELTKKGESENTEFKEKFDKETIETAGAFANTKGGVILVGISDKGKVKGVRIGKETTNDWANQISQNTEPRIIPEIEQNEIEGKSVVINRIKEFPIKPVSVKGRCFRRVGNSNRIMTPQEIAEMHLHSTGTSWDAFPAGDKTQIIDDLMVETDLIDQVDEAMKFVTRHISVGYEFEGKPRRKEVWEYPLEALREAVINAIVHRDYTAPSNVQVEIYDDRIDIWNPGRLLPGITIDDLYEKAYKSVIRNKLIAQAFYDIGYIEKYGSGTIKIIDLCKQHGIPSPEFKEFFGGFSVIFSDLQELVRRGILKELGEKKGRSYEML